MRLVIAAALLLLTGCGQSTASSVNGAPATTGEPPAVELDAPSVEHQALAGQWSFDRSCGLYDLVLSADGTATFYDYSDDPMTTNVGTWGDAGNHRTVLT